MTVVKYSLTINTVKENIHRNLLFSVNTVQMFFNPKSFPMLTMVLRKNNFTFNGDHYLQINGTAMGTKMAPSYANIFMGKFEKQLLERLLKDHFLGTDL